MAVLALQYSDPCGQLTQWCSINEMTGRVIWLLPYVVKLRRSLVWRRPRGQRPSWADEKQETSNISLLTCMRHSAVPTTNVAVSEVYRPTANRK